MKNGFSIQISREDVHIKSYLSGKYDDIYVQTETFEFLLEGVLLNRKKLLQEFALKDYETLVKELYFQKKENIFSNFEGEFRGFLWDKIQSQLFVFTNISSTQRVYYLKNESGIFLDSNLVRLSETLKNQGDKTEPDIESLYQLLCFGNLTEEKTPLKGVSKLLDGHFLKINCKTLEVTPTTYFDLSAVSVFSGSKRSAIDNIHDVFSESVALEYEKDSDLGTDSLALLSGGLDSRVAMFYAMKRGYKARNALCFSQSGYFDHTISEKIAADFGIHYEFIPLDGGKFLKKIDELTALSEGMVLFTGGIHVQHAVDNLRYENFSLFHSGQIGDGVLGGFNTEPRRKKPTYFKIVENGQFLPKVQARLDETLKKYETEELFLLRNIAYNRTVLGAHVLQQKRYQTSPFMTRGFLSLAISLPEEWKFNHRFYLDWIGKHLKEAANYRWERTLMKPNAQWKTGFGDKVVKRSFKIVNDKILKTPAKASMYPYDFYFKNDPHIQKYYQEYFEANLHRLESYPELLTDVKTLFVSPDFASKSQAVNILAIFKLFFGV